MALTTNIDVKFDAEFTKTLDLTTVKDTLKFKDLIGLADGTGNDQADESWHDERTLAASANETIDLAGSLTNAFGDTVTFVKIKAILVKADAGNTNDVQVAREGTNGAPVFLALGDGVAVQPDGLLLIVAPNAGYTVTAGTGDLLDITNSAGGTSVKYKIAIVGTTA